MLILVSGYKWQLVQLSVKTVFFRVLIRYQQIWPTLCVFEWIHSIKEMNLPLRARAFSPLQLMELLIPLSFLAPNSDLLQATLLSRQLWQPSLSIINPLHTLHSRKFKCRCKCSILLQHNQEDIQGNLTLWALDSSVASPITQPAVMPGKNFSLLFQIYVVVGMIDQDTFSSVSRMKRVITSFCCHFDILWSGSCPHLRKIWHTHALVFLFSIFLRQYHASPEQACKPLSLGWKCWDAHRGAWKLLQAHVDFHLLTYPGCCTGCNSSGTLR
jgi:hypothetical protein